MKMQMDVIAIYSGVEFDSSAEFFMARVRMKSGEETDIPIEREVFAQLMRDFIAAVQAVQGKAAPPAVPPAQPPAPVKPPAEKPLRVELGDKKKGPKPAPQPKPPAAAGDADGFSPLLEEVGAEEKEEE